jgi:signal transduction histidine kinase
VQEALTNAVRHAAASAVRIEIGVSEDGIVTAVTDDGVGFDVSAGHGGFGLIGMRERVAFAGGSLEIGSSDAGTCVTFRLPAARSGAEAVAELGD